MSNLSELADAVLVAQKERDDAAQAVKAEWEEQNNLLDKEHDAIYEQQAALNYALKLKRADIDKRYNEAIGAASGDPD